MVAYMTSPTAGYNDDYFNTQISATATATYGDGSVDWGYDSSYDVVDVPAQNRKWFLDFDRWGFPEDAKPILKTDKVKTVMKRKVLRCNRKGIGLRIRNYL